MSSDNHSVRAIALLLLLSVIWASSFTLIRITVDTVPPFTMVAFRLGFAGLFLLAVMRWSGKHLPRDRETLATFLLLALSGNVIPFTLIAFGEEEISSSLASILIGFMPLATALIAHVGVRDERLTPMRLAGVALGVAGIVVLVGADALSELGGHVLAELAVVGAALSYAVNTVLARRARALDPNVLATGTVIAGFAMILPVSLLVDAPWELSFDAGVMLQMIVLGIVCTAMGYMVFFRLTAMTGAVFTSMVNFLIPLIGLGFGLLFLDEDLTWSMVIALVLILSGLALNRFAMTRQA
ncbi:MAG: DMT family transporter [Alphaproteobacteria bacterium]|jgi:drug/metabolite transporter (DMT)-like permease|nr:DMT family transporter [Rhodospirillaceae bacterium]MDG2482101.1 DMT family transporter [Alphaproteobacteria bacterium]MBT6203876.1 DMT family transporter [Rhodospirillaceae bacterium]MBT6512830.1 DMT family transporter [Rhodospirillaceae bacterium]MBT7615365.1 DMT family transporter [Rhodospirillaceae bacterium]